MVALYGSHVEQFFIDILDKDHEMTVLLASLALISKERASWPT